MVERDPVCGMSVAPEKAAATVEFEGKRYFFCAKSCAAKFEKEPKRYFAGKMPDGMHGAGQGHAGGLHSIGGMKTGSAAPIKRSDDASGGDLAENGRLRKAGPTKADTAAGQGAGIRYTCPMHPEVVQLGPGSCPKCGMALEPMDVTAVAGPDPEYVSMRLRFWVSAALSLPVLLLGMSGEKFSFGVSMAAMRWIEFVLATPVVVWGGWPFFE